jgi:hypothetical protein
MYTAVGETRDAPPLEQPQHLSLPQYHSLILETTVETTVETMADTETSSWVA